MTQRCAHCDAPVPLMARSCPDCGAPNPSRRNVLFAVAAVAVLVPAIAIAIYVATRFEQPLIAGDRPVDQPLPAQSISGSDQDFAWLSAAMKQCDQKAGSEPDALHFLIVPLTFPPNDLERWRKASLNRIGNALVLPAADIVDGLRSKALTIDTAEYAFSVRDDKTQAVRKWEPATGVKWLSVADAADVASFKMQYKPRGKGRDDNWGNPFTHQKGTCYWINAIFEE